jgi:hypothetical protein
MCSCAQDEGWAVGLAACRLLQWGSEEAWGWAEGVKAKADAGLAAVVRVATGWAAWGMVAAALGWVVTSCKVNLENDQDMQGPAS